MQLSDLTKLPQTHVGLHRPCSALDVRAEMGATFAALNPQFYLQGSQGKSCSYFPLFSQSGTHVELIPLGKRMNPAQVGLLQIDLYLN